MPTTVLNTRRLAGLTLLVAALAGCASVPPTQLTDKSSLPTIKRFGVVSVAGGEFIRQHVGVTVFGNERDSKAIAPWGLDRAYEDQVAAAAARVFDASFVASQGSRAEFMKVNDPNGPWDAPAFRSSNWSGVEPAVRAACKKAELDVLLVVVRRKTGDVFFRTNQVVAGAGIYTRGSNAFLHLLASLGIVDCRTGKPLAERPLMRVTSLPEDVARSPISDWTPDVETRILEQLVRLPADAWEPALRSLLPKT